MRITPIQISMLLLAGHLPPGSVEDDERETLDDNYRAGLILRGRNELVSRTGANLGFDLLAWHQHLRRDDRFRDEYTFDGAWQAIRHTVLDAANDPARERLVTLAARWVQ